ncbi:MAG: hypothetical protein ACM3N7_10390 [Planctomycetaceae bacterium]
MKIESSMVALSSDHRLESQYTRTEKLDMWVDAPHPDNPGDRVTISRKAREASLTDPCGPTKKSREEPLEADPELLLIQILIEKLTGRKIKLTRVRLNGEAPDSPEPPSREDSPSQPERAGWGVRYEMHETCAEKEETVFRAGGIVRTADGQEIRFALDLKMSREFVQSTDVRFAAGDATPIDPLVINFSGTAAQLADQTFAFDLDADGKEEEVPLLAGGSGILVFDRNQDGKVNDGTELFGPSTGNAFAELAAYDGNGDRWVDESEAIYRSLFVRTRDAEGNDSLQGLKEAGVGALYVSSADSPFALKDSENSLCGQIVRTGIFLQENGGAGTLQQLNVVI